MYIRQSGYPKLRGKAYEIKNFGRALLYVFEAFCNQRLEVHRQVLLMLKLNVRMEDLLSEHKACFAFPAAAAAAEFRQCTGDMLLLHAAISRHFPE